MRVALKGRAAQQRLARVWAEAPAHEILTGECPFQELARSLFGGVRRGRAEQEGHINISDCNLLLDKLSHVIG